MYEPCINEEKQEKRLQKLHVYGRGVIFQILYNWQACYKVKIVEQLKKDPDTETNLICFHESAFKLLFTRLKDVYKIILHLSYSYRDGRIIAKNWEEFSVIVAKTVYYTQCSIQNVNVTVQTAECWKLLSRTRIQVNCLSWTAQFSNLNIIEPMRFE